MRTRTLATSLLVLVVLGTLVVLTSACSKQAAPGATSDGGASASAALSPSGALAATPIAEAPGTQSGTTFGSGFEGAISMHSVSAHGPTDMVFLTKGGKLRVDVPMNGQMAHSIFDPTTQKITVLMDSRQMAMQMPLAGAASGAGAPAASKGMKVTRTGKHETVAGYDCEDWDIASESGKRESACVAQGLAFFDFSSMAGPGNGEARSWAAELRDKNGFPLRAVELDASGKELSRMEVTKIEKKALDDATFSVPPGFHLMQVPGIGGGAPHPSHI